jgi:hypothetical protein
MKKKTKLKTIIRQMVREEVAMAIQEVITELKQPTQSQPQPKKIVEKKPYTNNSVLNDVLNETAEDKEWKTMGGGTYDSSKMNDVLQSSYGDMMNDSQPNGNLAASMGVNPNDAPDFLTKDYRAILKAVDKKRGK